METDHRGRHRKGTAKTACDEVLGGTPVTPEGLAPNILANAPTAPAYDAVSTFNDTVALASELNVALLQGVEGRTAVALFCYAAQL